MTKAFFDAAREIAGGRLTQTQVDNLNAVVDGLMPSAMKTSSSGIDMICGFEGKRLVAYDDGVGVWTIGFGTTVYPNGVKVKRGDTCTDAQAKQYMQHDLIKFEKAVNDSVTVPLNQNQFDALISLAYNIGTGAFAKSTLVKKLNAGDYKGAAEQFLVWNKGNGKIMQGLVNRRQREKGVFLK